VQRTVPFRLRKRFPVSMHSFWRVAVLYEWSGENRQKHGELKVRYPEHPESLIMRGLPTPC
jgi:hypothetical protein